MTWLQSLWHHVPVKYKPTKMCDVKYGVYALYGRHSPDILLRIIQAFKLYKYGTKNTNFSAQKYE